LRLIDFVYHSTLGLRVIKKKQKVWVLGVRVVSIWECGVGFTVQPLSVGV